MVLWVAVIDLSALLFLPGKWLYGSFLLAPDEPGHADVILVLYCGPDKNGALDRRTIRRVLYGSELVKGGVAPFIVCSGGSRPSRGFCGAAKMAALAVRAGVSSERVFVEGSSRDTLGNLRESKRIMCNRGWHSAVVVASTFQIRRLRNLLNAAEEDFYYAPVPYEYPPRLPRFEMWCYAQYSLLADIAYKVFPARCLEDLVSLLRK